MSELPKYENFVGQLNTKFNLLDFQQPSEVELVELTEPTVTASQTYFSLYFLGGKEFMLPQGTYRMGHEKLGEMLLFLVPVSSENDGFKYESVFNLLNEPAA